MSTAYFGAHLAKLLAGGSTLLPRTDPRLVLAWGGEEDTATAYGAGYGIQRVWPPAHISTLGSGIYHADGTTLWMGRETSAIWGGKTAFTFRLKAGQAALDGDTRRAELHGPSDAGSGSTNTNGSITQAIDERGKTYWLAMDFAIGQDVIDGAETLVLGGLHSQNWGFTPYSDGQDPWAIWAESGVNLWWSHKVPPTGDGKFYDVSVTPFNTSFSTMPNSASAWGTPVFYKLATMTADQRQTIIARVRLGDDAGDSPRTEIWHRAGSGPLVKRVDTTVPNTFSNGIRYWKWGLYKFTGTFTGSQTRTMRTRSVLVINDESAAGYAPLSEATIAAWLDR